MLQDTADKTQALEWVLDKLAAAKKIEPPKAPSLPKVDQAARKATDLDLWKTWKDSGKKPEHLDPLLKAFSGMMYDRVNKFKNRVEIPTAAIEHEHKKALIHAFETYDPSKAALGTHVQNRLLKAKRFVDTYQNFARIPDNISRHIGYFNAAKAELADKLGHEPDDQTLHDHILKNPIIINDRPHVFSMKDISRLNKEQRKGFISREGSKDEQTGVPNLSSREEEVIRLVHHQLSPQERLVHEYTFGLNGKPALKPGEIAKKLGMDGPKVSKLKKSIREKILFHLEG